MFVYFIGAFLTRCFPDYFNHHIAGNGGLRRVLIMNEWGGKERRNTMAEV